MAKMIEAIVDMEGDTAGQVAIETSGYAGVGCTAVQDAFTRGLGGEAIETKRKPEFNTKVTKSTCITR
jgi:hypothetical protein